MEFNIVLMVSKIIQVKTNLQQRRPLHSIFYDLISRLRGFANSLYKNRPHFISALQILVFCHLILESRFSCWTVIIFTALEIHTVIYSYKTAGICRLSDEAFQSLTYNQYYKRSSLPGIYI